MTKGQKKSERAPISALVASRRKATIILLMLESRMLTSSMSGVSASGPPRVHRSLFGWLQVQRNVRECSPCECWNSAKI